MAGAGGAVTLQGKAERAYCYLRQRIRDMELAPGTPLRKEEIAAELGVSRAPVSEAIARLADEMLVDVYPRHGSFVAPIRASDVRECLFIRTALEVEAARRVAARNDAAVAARLKDNLDQQQQALDGDHLTALYQLDQRFHDILLEALGHPRAAQLRRAAGVPLDRPRQFALPARERAVATVEEHRRILDGICLGDPEYAGAAMRSHLNQSARAVEAGLARLEAPNRDHTSAADNAERLRTLRTGSPSPG